MADNFDSSAISWWNGIPATPIATSSSAASIIDHPNMIDSSLHSNFTMDYWNQSLLTTSSTSSSGTIRPEPNFHAMLQEFPVAHPSIESSHHHQFLPGHNHHQQSGFPTTSQGLLEDQLKTQQPVFNQGTLLNNYQSTTSEFWNTTTSSGTNFGQVIYPSVSVTPAVQFGTPSFEQKPSCRSQTTKSNSEGVPRRSGSGSSSSSSTEVAATTAVPKKPRIQTPSPFPTFKVRKEKLGDRITALQQLVSPFGKTDTASVLHEATEHIKFLHDQVNVLSTPYLKNGYPMQHQQSSDEHSKDEDGQKQELRSRGLCLVPIECTYPVASETTPDFWTPSLWWKL